MITTITGGPGITISNGGGYMPHVEMTNPSAGMVRYNNSNLEVYDGYSWLILQSRHSQVNLSPEIQEIVIWARQKMAKEAEISKLAEKFPAISDLQGQLEMMITLCKDSRDDFAEH